MDKKNLYTNILIVFLVLMFIGGIALGGINVLSAEGQEPPEAAYIQSLKPLPKTKYEILSYLNDCVRAAEAGNARLDVKTTAFAEDGSISFGDGGGQLASSFEFAKEGIFEKVSGRFPVVAVDFGKDFSDFLWGLHFDPVLVEKAQSKEDGGNYTFTLAFSAGNDPFDKGSELNAGFHMRETEAALAFLRDSYKGFLNMDNLRVSCIGLTIDATVNRLTNEITGITYNKKLKIEADAVSLGELAAVGTKPLSFDYSEKTGFRFTWPGVALTPETLAMKKGDVKVVTAQISAPDGTKAAWSSSNPAVAEVDSEGYVKARAVSPEPVLITAEFTFLGKKYTDTCEVTVTVPVKRINLSDKKLTLAPGESKTLTAAVKPDDATVKGVLWHSSNGNVASVDKNGKVTAVSHGEAAVYALSKDGYYKITCTVTVTG